MSDDPAQEHFDRFVTELGAPQLGAEEAAAVLRLAKLMADATERRFAPLCCYTAGLMIGAGSREGDDRLARLRTVIDEVLAIASASADPETS